MAKNSSLERRGAVYYWRRRIPRRLVCSPAPTHLRLCLKTKEPAEARFLASHLDATADQIFMAAPLSMNNDELKRLFASAFDQHRTKLRMLADIARSDGQYDRDADAHLNRSIGWAYRHFSRFGENATFDADARERLVKEGLPAAEFDAVGDAITRMRGQGLAKGSIARVRALLEQQNVEPSAINIASARPVYLRALGEALLASAIAENSDPLPFDDIVRQILSGEHAVPAKTAVDSGPEVASHINTPLEAAATTQGQEGTPDAAPVLEIGEKLVRRKIKEKAWDEKSARQARSIFTLFSRFLVDMTGTDDLCQLRQKDLYEFSEFLMVLKKTYGKSPHDKAKSIVDLRMESLALPPAEQGMEIPTRNRHYTNIGLLLREAKKNGHRLDRDIDLVDFRGRDMRTAREVRPKPKTEQIEPIFSSPVFLGCKDWENPAIPGIEIYHGALYYGILLAVYQGARREEFCGLLVSDVVRNIGLHPYLHIGFTAQRRIKNQQSIRNLALHPEVLRLGFIEYVEAVEKLGYERLFPDLYSPSTSSPMGDRFYDEIRPVLSAAGVTPHQLRHFFNNALKQMEVTEEKRADLLGHNRGSETADRYCDPIEIEIQLREIGKLPVMTAHLNILPVRLVPWVERKEVAPWSKAAKLVRRARPPTRRG